MFDRRNVYIVRCSTGQIRGGILNRDDIFDSVSDACCSCCHVDRNCIDNCSERHCDAAVGNVARIVCRNDRKCVGTVIVSRRNISQTVQHQIHVCWCICERNRCTVHSRIRCTRHQRAMSYRQYDSNSRFNRICDSDQIAICSIEYNRSIFQSSLCRRCSGYLRLIIHSESCQIRRCCEVPRRIGNRHGRGNAGRIDRTRCHCICCNVFSKIRAGSVRIKHCGNRRAAAETAEVYRYASQTSIRSWVVYGSYDIPHFISAAQACRAAKTDVCASHSWSHIVERDRNRCSRNAVDVTGRIDSRRIEGMRYRGTRSERRGVTPHTCHRAVRQRPCCRRHAVGQTGISRVGLTKRRTSVHINRDQTTGVDCRYSSIDSGCGAVSDQGCHSRMYGIRYATHCRRIRRGNIDTESWCRCRNITRDVRLGHGNCGRAGSQRCNFGTRQTDSPNSAGDRSRFRRQSDRT